MQQTFGDFIAVRKKLKACTLYDYQRIMKTVLADWQNKAMLKINKDMVAKRTVKSALNMVKPMQIYPCAFCAPCLILLLPQYEDGNGHSILRENSVIRITQTCAWYRVERRQTVIKPHELELWFNTAMNQKNDVTSQNRETIRDYLLLVLFAGLRREEVARMT